MIANVYLSGDDCINQKRIVFNMEHIAEIVKSKELIKTKIITTSMILMLVERKLKITSHSQPIGKICPFYIYMTFVSIKS